MRPECCRPDIGVTTGRPGCYQLLVAEPQDASQHPLGTGWPPGPWSGPPGPPVLRLAPGALLFPLRIREEEGEEGAVAVNSMCQPGPAGCSEEPQGHEQRRCGFIPQHTSTTAESRALAAVWLCAVQPGVCVLDTLRKTRTKA